MDTTAENISRVVAILTAIISEQEDEAYAMVLESDPIELFSALTGILLSSLTTIAQIHDKKVEDYLKQLGMFALNCIQSMSFDLPEGITFNDSEPETWEPELPEQNMFDWSCDKCELKFEVLLVGENGRHTGQIKIAGNNSSTWQGPLPRDKDKAIKVLHETLNKKVDGHKERH